MNFIAKIYKSAKDSKLNTPKKTDSLITAKSQCSTLEETAGLEVTFEFSQIPESTGNVQLPQISGSTQMKSSS